MKRTITTERFNDEGVLIERIVETEEYDDEPAPSITPYPTTPQFPYIYPYPTVTPDIAPPFTTTKPYIVSTTND